MSLEREFYVGGFVVSWIVESLDVCMVDAERLMDLSDHPVDGNGMNSTIGLSLFV